VKDSHSITFGIAGLLIMALLTMPFAGCGKAKGQLPPGAINSFDATTYSLLLSFQKGIDSVKADFATQSPAVQAQAAPFINQAVKDYNIGEAAWQAYHSGATADTNGLTSALWQLTADLGNLGRMTPAKTSK
jgi:hypothetical protein